jgi:outer membrane protein OmpA-like peptidoglycan-associated protein
MSFNILEAVKGQLTPELISKATKFLGENESGVAKAMSGILPTILSGMVSKASTNSTGATEVLNAAKETHQSGLLGGLGNMFSNGGGMVDKGLNLVKGLFGDKVNGIITAISSFAGIKSSSAGTLLSMAAPMAAGTLGKHAAENNLDAGGLASLLSSQKSTIMNALPSGLSGLAGMLGLGKISDAVSSIGGNTKKVMNTAEGYTREKAAGGMKWLLPLLGLILAGALAWWFLLGGKSGCSSGKAVAKDTTVAINSTDTVNKINISTKDLLGTIDSATGNFVYNLGKMITIDLPNNGGKLEVGENSTEAKLIGFLNDASQTIDTAKGNWFEFTNVKFKTGGSEITDESMAQLKNMVAIANAYPSAQFKIGGYTDNTGKAESNVALSQKRADAVLNMLKKSGVIEKSLTGAKGYGQEYPIGDNATPEGRAINRRVAVNVKAK